MDKAFVIYTVNRFSPVTIISSMIPFSFHHPLNKLFYGGGDEEDVFPVQYKMNTRNCIKNLFENYGFVEEKFTRLDDLIFQKISLLNLIELWIWKMFKFFGATYPEHNLLGIYRKTMDR